MSQKLDPIGNRILVAPVKEDSNSDVIIPSTNEKKRPEKGEVIKLGKDYEGAIKKGDIVLWEKFEVTEFEYNGKKYYVGFPDSFHIRISK